MEFRVLGALEVVDDGRVLALGRPAERHLFALLVCLANEAVPVDRLIEELWEEEPPTTAGNIIQRYVSRLRRSLGDEAAQRLTTDPAGYRLRIAGNELDWSRFESMVSQASRLEDPEAASTLLSEALGLWRGPALAGCGDSPTIAAERVRLEEARMAALEERIERDLEMGRHRELVAELESMSGQFPLRERLRAQSMMALYRCDRQADALRAYADYRSRLVEETGLEPSPTLADLEERILVRSPDLDLPPARVSPATNLPHRISTFVGRASEINQVADLVASHRLVTLVGVGGIGKTSLALEVAAGLVHRFPDGVWLIDFSPLSDPALIGGTAAAVLGARVAPREDPVEALTRYLEVRTTLIVLDNCEHLISAVAEFASTLLRATASVRVLATSREPLALAGEAVMRVPPLEVPGAGSQDVDVVTDSEAVALFADRARLLRPEFKIDANNAAEVAGVCRKLDGIPLAIELAAARLGTMRVDQIAANIGDRYQLLTRGARTAPQRHQTLQALVDWSYDLLTEDERVLFRRLAAFAGTFSLDAAEQVCGFDPLPTESVPDLLDQIVDASLAVPPDPNGERFRMLQTIREYARRRLDTSGETDATMHRLATYLLEAGPESRDGYPGSDHAAWYRWLDDEQDNYRAVLEWSLQTGNSDIAVATAIEFRGYLVLRQQSAEALAWINGALELVGEETSQPRLILLAQALGIEAFRGDPARTKQKAQSLYREARALDDASAMGWARGVEAVLAWKHGDTTAANALTSDAIEHFLEADDPRVLSLFQIRAGHLVLLGDYEEARGVVSRITDETARLGDRGDPRYVAFEANTFKAFIAVHGGDLEEAEQRLDDQSEYVQHLGPEDRFAYLFVRWSIAMARGDPAAARSAATEIRQSLPDTAMVDRLRDAALVRALALLDANGPEAALPDLRQAIDLARQDVSVIDTADLVRAIADTAQAADDHDQAVLLHAAASTVYEQTATVLFDWEQRRLHHSLEALTTILGATRFNELWTAGSTLTFDEMVNEAARYLHEDRTTTRPDS